MLGTRSLLHIFQTFFQANSPPPQTLLSYFFILGNRTVNYFSLDIEGAELQVR
jgi:hypothetical protein